MKRYKNKSIKYKGKEYEITWISEFAYHVMVKFSNSTHQINHVEIEKLLLSSMFTNERKDIYIALGRFRNKIYKTIVLLKNSRCIVKTSYSL